MISSILTTGLILVFGVLLPPLLIVVLYDGYVEYRMSKHGEMVATELLEKYKYQYSGDDTIGEETRYLIGYVVGERYITENISKEEYDKLPESGSVFILSYKKKTKLLF